MNLTPAITTLRMERQHLTRKATKDEQPPIWMKSYRRFMCFAERINPLKDIKEK
ncbi:MAG: hypothetical protein LBM69_03445 [Lachnospiraceae bacterium]|nr:hypothetical protein [Lachnospiraceae bacterium]